jgi:hypothetical protein
MVTSVAIITIIFVDVFVNKVTSLPVFIAGYD